MGLSHFRIAAIAGILWAAGAPGALADIYKVVDENGAVLFTNTPPQDRTLIAEVYPTEEWPKPPPAEERQAAELRALNERVDRLTRLLEDSGSAPSYSSPQYVAVAPPDWDDRAGWNTWDTWYGWNGWYGSPFFGPGVVVVGAPFGHGFRHFNKFHGFNSFGFNKFNHFNRFGSFTRFGTFNGPRAVMGARPQFAPRAAGVRFPGARGGFRRR